MQAYVIDPASPGGIRRTEVPDPVPLPSQAVIAVAAFSLNRGEIPSHGMFPVGMVPGWDTAGNVIEAARDGSGPKVGTGVVGFSASGAWAERRAIDTSSMSALPQGLDATRASTLPVAGLTALRALRALGPIVGRSVLVTGASGGVGSFAVKLARLGGAHVVAMASSHAKRRELVEAGAHEAISDLEQLSTPLYGVIENVGGRVLTDAWNHIRTGGILVSIGYASGEPASFPPYATVGPRKTLISFQVHQPGVWMETIGEDLAYLAGLTAKGDLDAAIVWQGSWDRLAEAICLLESRKISGKAVLTIP